jgi:hypothetical protein
MPVASSRATAGASDAAHDPLLWQTSEPSMAQPFIVVDLAPGARDFQPIALEPGRPMLDRLKSNYQVLRAWLKDYVAEPESDAGEAVGFLIPARLLGGADAGQASERPVVDACVPVTPRDLGGPLRKELDELRRLIQQAAPKTATERALHRVLVRARDTQLDPGHSHPGCTLFKYRDAAGKWRLVWCWGYQRRDEGLGEPVVRDGRLYFRRPGERLSDLAGSGAVVDEDAPRPGRRRRRLRVAGLLTGLMLLVLGAAGGWWSAQPGNMDRLRAWCGFPPAHVERAPNSLATQSEAPTPQPPGPGSPTAKPFTLKITPEGPEDIPVGWVVPLQVWKDYGDNRREQLTEAPKWKAEEVSGLTFRDGEVEATEPDAGPLKIKAVYQGQESNEVVLRSVARAPVTLTIDVPRPILLVGEKEKLTLSATDEQGIPVDLAEGRAEFALAPGADPKVLELAPDGSSRAAGVGTVTVTASHPASQQPANRELTIVPPSQVQLLFQPDRVTVAVGAITGLKLLMKPTGGGGTPIPLGDDADVVIKYGNPKAALWESPDLVGVEAAPQFPLEATYQGLKATAQVQVVAPDAATALRIRQTEASPPPDQPLAKDFVVGLAGAQPPATSRAPGQPLTKPSVAGPAGAPPSVAARAPGQPLTKDHAAATAKVAPSGAAPAPARPSGTVEAAATARVPPSEATLAPGQAITLTVEQQVDATWQEVQPDLVIWEKPPEGVDWTPPGEGLRPIAALREGTGAVTLTAEYPPKGKGATFTLRPMSKEQLAALRKETEALLKDPKSRIVMTPQRPVTTRRGGRSRSTRFTPMIQGGGQFAPLVGGVWPNGWNSPYWGWNGPVLTSNGLYHPGYFPYGYGGENYRGYVNAPRGRVRRPSGPAPVVRSDASPRSKVDTSGPATIPNRSEKIAILEEPNEYMGSYSVNVEITVPGPDWTLEYRIARPGIPPGDGWKRAENGRLVLESQEFPAAADRGDLEIEVRDPSQPAARPQTFHHSFSLVRPKARVMSTGGG